MGIESIHIKLQTALASLQLSAYAVDAMRVLDTLSEQADVFPTLNTALGQACPDWRNPGSTQNPSGSIAIELAQTAQTMHGLLDELAQVIAGMAMAGA